MNNRLRQLRLKSKMTQEELAEKMNVSRQTVAKWEAGDSIPDIAKCSVLASIFNLYLDDIADMFIDRDDERSMHPKNQYFLGISKIENRTVVLPENAMKMYGFKEGDVLLILGNSSQGISLASKNNLSDYEEKKLFDKSL
ncbi:MAG: helix-turn-helix transcriptional regulator [Ruminococcus sp.]|nr:helix-turn-helix transcriptional regulator [Ruminococcus sp.]